MSEEVKITHVKAILDSLDHGLCKGVGRGGPGQMCVQHAVSIAFGEKRGDEPKCVDPFVTADGIMINDAPWPTKKARADGMRRFAIAQLGTASLGFDTSEYMSRRSTMLAKEFAGESVALICEWPHSFGRDGETTTETLTRLANRLADILEKMETPGSQYLCMIDDKKE